MKKFILLATTFLLVLIIYQSCQEVGLKQPKISQPQLTNDEINRLVLLDTNYVFTEGKARDFALLTASKFLDSKDKATRSISEMIVVPSLYSATGKTSIKTDFRISKPQTPSLYIVNFKDRKGYVVLSADKRAHGVLAVVGAGTFDATAHIGLRIFLENAVKHVDEKVAQLEPLRGDRIFNSMVAKLEASMNANPSDGKPTKDGRTESSPCQYQKKIHVPGQSAPACDPSCYAITTTSQTSTYDVTAYVQTPLLSTLWDQGPPFNNGQPIIIDQLSGATCFYNGRCGISNRFPAGCVSVAEGQVVAHFKAKIDPFWQSIVNTPACDLVGIQSGSVSNLLHNIYLDYGLYVSRHCDGTSAGVSIGDIHLTNPRGISPTYGLVQGEWRDWNTGDIRNSLCNGSPVVIFGMQHLCCFMWCWGCGEGHEWVIDGMRDVYVQTTYQVLTSYIGENCPSDSYYTYSGSSYATQIHQNWGWGQNTGSQPNDWYAQDCFQSTISTSDDINFNHANYIVAYITQQ